MRRTLSGLLPTLLLFVSASSAVADPPRPTKAADSESRARATSHDGDDDDNPQTPAPPATALDRQMDRADQEKADADRASGTLAPTNLQPLYQGVGPGSAALPPKAPRLPMKGPARLVWPGFQVREGVATVFLQLTSDVAWDAVDGSDRIVYTLRATQVHLRNNARPLDVNAFGTVVRSVETRRKGRDVEVTIHLKQKATRKERMIDAAGGFRMLLIELLPS